MASRKAVPVWLTARSLTGRLLLISLAWLAIALSGGGYLISDAFHDHVEDEFDARLTETLDALIGTSDLDRAGALTFTRELSDQRFSEPYSGWYWQVGEPAGTLVRSRSLWDQELTIPVNEAAFDGRVFEATGPEGRRIRVMVRDVVLPESEKVYRFAVAGDATEMQDHVQRFDRIILWSLGTLGAGILLALVLQVAVGLSPLRKVRRSLAAVREGKARKLPEDCPPEIAPLVEDMNAVLRHNETLVERARTQMGNLAHALKTPLTIIRNEMAGLAKTPGAKTVEKQAEIIQRQIDYQLARARVAGSARHLKTRTSVAEAVQAVLRTLRRLYKGKPLAFDTAVPERACFLGERQDLEEILGNLLENAAKWAKGRVRVSAANGRGGFLRLVVEDDGPGVDKPALERLFVRGERLDETVPGSGLGLAIVRDLADTYGGKAAARRSPLGGLLVEVMLPGEISKPG
jgi:signal transduction histidine kinase